MPTLEEVFLRLTGEGTKQYGGKMSKEEKKKMRQKLAKREETVEKEVAEKEVENTEDRAEQMEEKEEQYGVFDNDDQGTEKHCTDRT